MKMSTFYPDSAVLALIRNPFNKFCMKIHLIKFYSFQFRYSSTYEFDALNYLENDDHPLGLLHSYQINLLHARNYNSLKISLNSLRFK